MGKNRRSKINRLPNAERTNPSSKISVLSPQMIEQQILESMTRSAFPQQRSAEPYFEMRNRYETSNANETSQKRTKIRMDDEALAKILSFAGTATTLAARDVCVQWRRVANEVLSHITRIDLSKIYLWKRQRVPPPTDNQILRTLHIFTSLRTLVINSWPYEDVLPDISTIICTGLFSQTLSDVEFSGVFVQGEALVQLLERCPTISHLKLTSHDSIDDDVFSKLTSYWLSKSSSASASTSTNTSEGYFNRSNQPRLLSFTITNTRTLSGDGISFLLRTNFARSVMLSKCHGINFTNHCAPVKHSTNILSITNSPNLRRFHLIKQDSKQDVNELNLSQCPSLRSITIGESRELRQITANKVFDIRKLILSGCRSLRDITISGFNPVTAFANLEELVLFGARNISSSVFSSVFGLSNDECALPKLRRLELNGCSVEKINLISYQNLTSATFSGCWNLKHLTVTDCWKLERFAVSGRNIPLQTATIVVPVSCEFEGRGRNWHWQESESHQSYLFP